MTKKDLKKMSLLHEVLKNGKVKKALNSKKMGKLYQKAFCRRCSLGGCTLMMKSRVLFLCGRPREVEHERWILS